MPDVDDDDDGLRKSDDGDIESGNSSSNGGRRRRSGRPAWSTLTAVTLALLLLLGASGGVAWWLHSPSSATVDSRFVWWQRLFAEHGEDLASVTTIAPAATSADAVSSAVVAVHSALLANAQGVCANTVQGRDLVTDDQGFVCAPDGLDAARPGCCRMPAETGFERFSCETCDTRLGCCGVYEFCVACCLGPQNQAPVDALRHAASSEHALHVCAALCRTSSLSVTGQRQYRTAKKHCFAAGANNGAGFIREARGRR